MTNKFILDYYQSNTKMILRIIIFYFMEILYDK